VTEAPPASEATSEAGPASEARTRARTRSGVGLTVAGLGLVAVVVVYAVFLRPDATGRDPGVAFAFLGGLASFVTPCVLPLVPGYLSLVSGVSVAELQTGATADTGRVLRATLLFVAGFTLVFVALGAGASALGSLLNDHRQVLDRVAGIVVIVMGLFLAGVVSPRFLVVERRFHVPVARLGALAPPLMGMAFALGWTPCIGPILGAVITQAETEATLGRGVTLLFAYSLGLGVPFVYAGLALGRMTSVFSWVRRHFRAINVVSGLALTLFGVLLLTDNVTWLSRQLIDLFDTLHLDALSSS
jgi:cytochrome c-type biogenesis protein